MPHLDGFALLELLAPHLGEGTYLPVLVLTADISSEAKQRALSMGAKDFLSKPFDSTEVVLRIKNLLEARFLYLALQEQNDLLETKVQQRTREFEEAQVEILERLALAAEFRDDATQEHTQRVGELSAPGADAGPVEHWCRYPARSTAARPREDRGPRSHLLKLGRLTEDSTIIGITRWLGRASFGQPAPAAAAPRRSQPHTEHWDGSAISRRCAATRFPAW
jgi:putative two-component system response regulator